MLYNNIVKLINKNRSQMCNYSDEELHLFSDGLKNRYKDGESLDALLPEAFALVREATRRVLGLEHYDVQLASGIALHRGCIAEAKTGEGKTISIYLPAYLNSLTGKGVHIVTVNDYLAKRDADAAERVFSLLGVSVGCILRNSTNDERQRGYNCDITYVTNSELGFDYLKDHLKFKPEDLVLRTDESGSVLLNYAIIDEVDSILIDEAKTPLIIAGPSEDNSELLLQINDVVKSLKEGTLYTTTALEKLTGQKNEEDGDFIYEEKDNVIYLTEQGTAKVESGLGIDNLNSDDKLYIRRAVNNSLKANFAMKRDVHYIVNNGEVLLVDSFTGRALPGRRFTDGLHQAIEAKEGVEINGETVVTASVTYQSFFNKYTKKAGLTGTAKTSAKEFNDIYKLKVIEIPTNKPVIRKDMPDAVYVNKDAKWKAVVSEIKATHSTGQPVLVGTVSIEDSVLLSDMLDTENIPHNTLNANNEALEAQIVAEAGQKGAVTIATNMAGRGTDIKLGAGVAELGGLCVIGTERHDSRRIDNQLQGRSGRQGDPGSAQFILSLDDRIMRVFGEESQLQLLMSLGEADKPIQYGLLSKIIQKAQNTVEDSNRMAREEMLKYAEADDEIREEAYKQREQLLCTKDIAGVFKSFADYVSDKFVNACWTKGEINADDEIGINNFLGRYFSIFPEFNINFDFDKEKLSKIEFAETIHQLNSTLIDARLNEFKEQLLNPDAIPEFIDGLLKSTVLKMFDREYTDLLFRMRYIKNHISYESYAGREPAVAYKAEGKQTFDNAMENIIFNSVFQFFRLNFSVVIERKEG